MKLLSCLLLVTLISCPSISFAKDNEKDTSNNETKVESQIVYSKALKGKDKEFLNGVQKRIDTRHGKQKIEPLADFSLYESDSKDNIYAEYVLRKPPMNLEYAKKDAYEVFLFMIKELMALGINPGKEKAMVSLRLCQHEKGLTGKKQIRYYGRWRYNPYTDEAEWLAPSK